MLGAQGLALSLTRGHHGEGRRCSRSHREQLSPRCGVPAEEGTALF